MILSNRLITKAQIRLCECPSWSGPLLFAHPEDRFFSHQRPYVRASRKGSCEMCDSVLFGYKMLIGILVISLDENCTIPEN